MKLSEKAWLIGVKSVLVGCVVIGSLSVLTVSARAATLPASDAPPLVNGWYQISTPQQLEYIDQNQDPYLTDYMSGNIELMNNINLSSYSWEPFGGGPSAANQDYSGMFNGNGYTVSNLNINSGSGEMSVGFFGATSGTIENVDVGEYVTDTNSLSNVGGLVGMEDGGRITNSGATGVVSVQVSGSANSLVGGLVGAQYGSIANSYANALVMGGGGFESAVGGLVGQQGGAITNSYAAGSLTGGSALGGLVGSQKSGSITNSYATAAASANTGADVGGLVGVQGGSVSNSFFDTTTTGQMNGAGVNSGSGSATPESTTAMQTESTFQNAGWNFTNTWGMSPSVNGGFPYLLSDTDTLGGLAVSSGTLSPMLATGTLNYTDSVANSVTSLTVTPTATDSTATVSVSVYGQPVSGTTSYTIPLSIGSNPIQIDVKAQDGTKQTYTLTVNRASLPVGQMPEVPFAGLLPVAGVGAIGLLVARRRK